VEWNGIDGKPSNPLLSRLSGKPDQNQGVRKIAKIGVQISSPRPLISASHRISFLRFFVVAYPFFSLGAKDPFRAIGHT